MNTNPRQNGGNTNNRSSNLQNGRAGQTRNTQYSNQQNQPPRQNPPQQNQQTQPRKNQAQNQNGQHTYNRANQPNYNQPNTGGSRQNPNRGAAARSNQQGAVGRNQTSQTPIGRINSQNPDKRRAEQKKIKLTAEQIEINRINRQRERYYIKKHRSAAIRVFISRFMLFLVVLAILCGFTASALFLDLTKQDSPDKSGYSYEIGDNDVYSLPYADAVREGHIFVCFTDIANLCDLAVVGSTDDVKYIIKGDDAETIRFMTGTRVVYVNSVETRLGANCYYEDEKLYVPVDFVKAYMMGLDVTVDTEEHRVTVKRTLTNELDENGELPEGEEPIYADLYFLLKRPSMLESISEDDAKALAVIPDLGFVNNLDPYEEYMNPGNTTEYLTLVNVSHPLSSDYVPQDLTVIENTRDDGRAPQQMRLYAAKALEALFKEMEAAGFTDVDVTSGYRSYSYQESLFNQRLEQYAYLGDGAYAAAAQIVNPPGSSEHQSGLCVDMHNISTGADVSFGETEQFKWLRDNCWKFGFILRYPEDKTEITGISYEPWHYRYVGRYHAQQMYELGMCLEEYWEYIS